MDYNKSQLLEAVSVQLGAKLEGIRGAAEVARVDSIAAEGRMQSRYDSAKEELGALADRFNIRGGEVDLGLRLLAECPLPLKSTIIELGAIATLELLGKDQLMDYFILPYGGGTRVAGPAREILVVIPESPIAEAMWGKREGSVFVTRSQKNYKIREIR